MGMGAHDPGYQGEVVVMDTWRTRSKERHADGLCWSLFFLLCTMFLSLRFHGACSNSNKHI